VPERITFGSVEVRVASREVFVRGHKAKLPWRTFDVLRLLIQARSEVVSKQEILRHVWGGEFINDSNLTQAVAQIRKALDPPPEGRSYVETIPRIGYRLSLTPVILESAVTGDAQSLEFTEPPTIGQPRTGLFRRWRIAPIALVLSLLSAGCILYWTYRRDPRPDSARTYSVAVLPLEDLSGDPDQDYFTAGITAALTLHLAKISALRVVLPASALPRKTQGPAGQIARKLRVDYVVHGSVRRQGDRVWIAVQLIAAAAGRRVWAESYERDLQEILTLQGEMARVIAREIRVQVTPQDQVRLARARAVNRSAYEAYLKGRYYQAKRTEDGLKRSIAYFQEAVSTDPGYGQAYSGLADSHTYLANHGFVAPRTAAPQAKAMAAKAVELGDGQAEGHTSLAYIKMVYDWDWPGAASELQRSIDLDPGYARAHSLFACYFALQRRFDDALREIHQALDLDPLSIYDNANLGWHLQAARRYNDAIDQFRKTLDLDPGSAQAHFGLGRALEQKRLYREAIAEFQRAVSLAGDAPGPLAGLAHAYAESGNTPEAHKALEQLRDLSQRRYVSSYDMAVVYTALGNDREAFASLHNAQQNRDGYLWLWLNVDPRFDRLRPNARFTALLANMGLRNETPQ
jgi:TolB-like protein/DNA-binding winged helix-turn-helix (wHTH) protein/Flp pilus assembly protein TadD